MQSQENAGKWCRKATPDTTVCGRDRQRYFWVGVCVGWVGLYFGVYVGWSASVTGLLIDDWRLDTPRLLAASPASTTPPIPPTSLLSVSDSLLVMGGIGRGVCVGRRFYGPVTF